jgi:hypothetical protein
MSSTFNASILTAEDIARVSGGYVDWETDWCGTKVPGWPRPKTFVTNFDAISPVALNPQPLPPMSNDFGMMF